MGARRCEDLAAWQLSNDLRQKIDALVAESRAREDRRFSEQVRGAAASAARNLAEGFGCYRPRDLARYTRIAKASLLETTQHLAEGVDRHHWTAAQAAPLRELAHRAIGACVRLLRYLEAAGAPEPHASPRGRDA